MIIEEITMAQFAEGLEQTQTVLIPFGATEEHGPHLPLATDTLHAVTVARRLAERRTIFIAPPVPYGVCRSSSQHPGTLSIRTETLKALAIDIVSALYRQGMRRFVLLTGHAGGTHFSTLLDAGETLLERFADAEFAVLTEFMLASEAGRKIIETEGDSHAGEIETSRMLHSHPDLVQGTAAEEYPSFPKGILVRDKQKYWPGGVWGNPQKANAEKGQRIEEVVLDALEQLIDRLEAISR